MLRRCGPGGDGLRTRLLKTRHQGARSPRVAGRFIAKARVKKPLPSRLVHLVARDENLSGRLYYDPGQVRQYVDDRASPFVASFFILTGFTLIPRCRRVRVT